MSDINIGIDLGGSHVAIGVVDNKGQILEQFEKDFTIEEKKNVLPVAIRYIVDTLRELKQNYDFLEFGLGMAGAISDGVIWRSVNLGVENYDIKTELENRTGLSVHIKNDAKCAALAEYKYGDLKEYNNIVFLTLGTGIGGAYIYHGSLMQSDYREGYELGHMIIKAGGKKCRCGKNGCFETYGGILAFKNKVISRLNLSHNIPGPELRDIMDKTIDKITDIIDEYVSDLAIGISNLINIFEPDCIVKSGDIKSFIFCTFSCTVSLFLAVGDVVSKEILQGWFSTISSSICLVCFVSSSRILLSSYTEQVPLYRLSICFLAELKTLILTTSIF